ncbi:hypothetical protein BIV04_01870 [Frigoribacterium sp. MCBA15_019]|nr:hypothetical protein BIV04_01870 [Frigoribacterium sp. MCBA15_019]
MAPEEVRAKNETLPPEDTAAMAELLTPESPDGSKVLAPGCWGWLKFGVPSLFHVTFLAIRRRSLPSNATAVLVFT